jgi:hypothetical protein
VVVGPRQDRSLPPYPRRMSGSSEDENAKIARLKDVLQRASHAMSPSSPDRMSTRVDVKQFWFVGFGLKKYSHLARAICTAARDGRTEEVSAGNVDQVVASSAV